MCIMHCIQMGIRRKLTNVCPIWYSQVHPPPHQKTKKQQQKQQKQKKKLTNSMRERWRKAQRWWAECCASPSRTWRTRPPSPLRRGRRSGWSCRTASGRRSRLSPRLEWMNRRIKWMNRWIKWMNRWIKLMNQLIKLMNYWIKSMDQWINQSMSRPRW